MNKKQMDEAAGEFPPKTLEQAVRQALRSDSSPPLIWCDSWLVESSIIAAFEQVDSTALADHAMTLTHLKFTAAEAMKIAALGIARTIKGENTLQELLATFFTAAIKIGRMVERLDHAERISAMIVPESPFDNSHHIKIDTSKSSPKMEVCIKPVGKTDVELIAQNFFTGSACAICLTKDEATSLASVLLNLIAADEEREANENA